MTWYAVFRRETGELVSTGTVVAERLPADLEALPLESGPDFSRQRWNPNTRTLDAYTPPEPPCPACQAYNAFKAEPPISGLTKAQPFDGVVAAAAKRFHPDTSHVPGSRT